VDTLRRRTRASQIWAISHTWGERKRDFDAASTPKPTLVLSDFGFMGIAAMVGLLREFARTFAKSQDHKPHVTEITIRWLLKELGWVKEDMALSEQS